MFNTSRILPVVFCLTSLLFSSVSLFAQTSTDQCDPSAIISTFYDAAIGNSLEAWVDTYRNARCEANVTKTVDTLREVDEQMQLDYFVLGGASEECEPNQVIEDYRDAVLTEDTDKWENTYNDTTCPEFIAVGAGGLQRAFEMLNLTTSSIEVEEVEYNGDVVVLHTVDQNGVVETWDVATTQSNFDDWLWLTMYQGLFEYDLSSDQPIYQSSSTGGFVIKQQPLGYFVVPFISFRFAHLASDNEYKISLSDGSTIMGTFETTLVTDVLGNTFTPSLYPSIALTTLPEVFEEFESPEPQKLWRLDIHDQSFNAVNFRLVYAFSGVRANCVGACGYTSQDGERTLHIQIEGRDTPTDTAFDNLQGIVFTSDTDLTITLPNDQQIQASYVLNNRRDSQSFDRLLVCDIVDDNGGYLYTAAFRLEDENYPITLEASE